jgi:signal peptidase II
VPIAVNQGRIPRLGFALAGLVIVLDQLSKWWVLDAMAGPPRVVAVAPFLNLVLVMNRGVSFGMFSAAPDWLPCLLAGFAVLISAALAFWMRRVRERLLAAGLALVIGGALGNVIDRFRFGAVVDFLDFHAAGYHWPAFNVADSAITVGVGLLLLDALKSPSRTT